jgi:hypothetical protein
VLLIGLQSFCDIVSCLKSRKLGSGFLLLNLKKLEGKWKLGFELNFFTLCNKNKMMGSFSFENQNNDV